MNLCVFMSIFVLSGSMWSWIMLQTRFSIVLEYTIWFWRHGTNSGTWVTLIVWQFRCVYSDFDSNITETVGFQFGVFFPIHGFLATDEALLDSDSFFETGSIDFGFETILRWVFWSFFFFSFARKFRFHPGFRSGFKTESLIVVVLDWM